MKVTIRNPVCGKYGNAWELNSGIEFCHVVLLFSMVQGLYQGFMHTTTEHSTTELYISAFHIG